MRLEPAANGGGEDADVAIDGQEGSIGVIAGTGRAAVAGAGRVDEHQVGEREPGVGIVDRGRVLARDDGDGEGDAPWADGAEVEEGGSGAGTAVEGERDRAVRSVMGEGGGDDLGGRLNI